MRCGGMLKSGVFTTGRCDQGMCLVAMEALLSTVFLTYTFVEDQQSKTQIQLSRSLGTFEPCPFILYPVALTLVVNGRHFPHRY